MRTYFITPAARADIAAIEVAVRALGAQTFEPARVLPAREIVVDGYGEVFVVPVSARIIYRADFPEGVLGGVDALRRVRGVSKVRATLAHAPAGEDLPAALRPLPKAPHPPVFPKTPGSRSDRRRWAVVEVRSMTEAEAKMVAEAFSAIGVDTPSLSRPARDERMKGSWKGGAWTLFRYAYPSKPGRLDLRIACDDPEEAQRLLDLLPGAKKVR